MQNENLLKESIQLILNYNDHSIVIKQKKYKTLEDIKEKAYELFYPIKKKINIYSNNKNLESFVSQPIGYIFPGQSFANLKIVEIDLKDYQHKILKRFKNPNIINDYTSLYSRLNFQKNDLKKEATSVNDLKLGNKDIKNKNKRNKLNSGSSLLSKNNLILLKSELNKTEDLPTTRKLFSSNSVDNLNILKYNDKKSKLNMILPPINKKNNANQNFKKELNIKRINPLLSSAKENEKKNLNNILYNKCNNCFLNKISIYCRLCDSFLCINCAYNKKSINEDHKKHKDYFIKLDKNNNCENINKYQNLLISDFNKALDDFKILDETKLETTKENSVEKFNYDTLIENLDKNVEKLVTKANDMKGSIKLFKLNEIDKKDDKTVKEKCDDEKKILQKFNVYEYTNQIEPFLALNKIEKDMSKYFKTFEESNDQRIYIKSQIELLFDNVENEVDKVLDDIENIFGNTNK